MSTALAIGLRSASDDFKVFIIDERALLQRRFVIALELR